jgi:hypothetical protein
MAHFSSAQSRSGGPNRERRRARSLRTEAPEPLLVPDPSRALRRQQLARVCDVVDGGGVVRGRPSPLPPRCLASCRPSACEFLRLSVSRRGLTVIWAKIAWF